MASIDERTNADSTVAYKIYWNLPKSMIPAGQSKAKASLTVYSRKDALAAKGIAEKHKHAITGMEVEDELTAEKAKEAGTGAMTLERWADTWIKSLNPGPERSQRQIDTYANQFRGVILPHRPGGKGGKALGDYILEDLEHIDIQSLYTDLSSRGRRPATVKTYHAAIRACLNDAVKSPKTSGLLTNPALAVKLSSKSDVDEEREPQRFFEPDQYHLIRESVDPRSRLLVEFLAETGVRFSEATALTVDAFTWDTNVAEIARAHKRTYSGRMIKKAGKPKGRSDRWVEVTPSVMNKVRLHVEQAGLAKDDLVFRALRHGRVHHSNFLKRVWVPTLTRLAQCPVHMPAERESSSSCSCLGDTGWTKFNPHALRHSWATWQILAGQPISFISRQLGHPDTAFTERTYVHLFKSRPLGMGTALEAYLGRA